LVLIPSEADVAEGLLISAEYAKEDRGHLLTVFFYEPENSQSLGNVPLWLFWFSLLI